MAFFQRRNRYATLPVTPRDVPEGLVERCPSCRQLIVRKELEKTAKTCPQCGYHFSMSAQERVALLADPDSFQPLFESLSSADPLGFPEYREKVAVDQEKTGLREAVYTGSCTLEGHPVYLGVMDARFRMASMGSVVGEKICRLMEEATRTRRPLILVCASGGARMQEGMLSLLQMAKTAAAAQRLDEAGVLFISVLTHPTTGGVTASFAVLGDILLAEPGATIGFAGRRIIEQTMRQRLPEDFQTAEFLLKHGMLDDVVPRSKLRATLAQLVALHDVRGQERQAWPAN
ncbi:MAG: acetyl-CoA carboxylase carboxyltransferase subunit beta [Firmicutes bacterium]|nr:acetyl-CoA carboxylase carboxyltransferase subunit beta [Bacillota bacterium]